MKRTTIFLPDQLHEELRRDAFRAQTSMAELIRRKLQSPARSAAKRQPSQDPILKVAGICGGPLLSSDIDEELYGG